MGALGVTLPKDKESVMPEPTFFLTLTPTDAVDHGIVPDGATVIAYEGDAPFAGRVVLAGALAVILRLQAAWLPTRWDAEPQGRRADLRDADLRDADLTDADLRRAVLTGAVLRGAVLTGADLTGADLRGAVLTDADLRRAVLRGAVLTGAVGLVTPEEEEATLSAAVAAIAQEPERWNQELWHGEGYNPATATEVGACGTAHCLAGWMQAQLPIGHDLRKVSAYYAGVMLAPRAAAAGWFGGSVHPDLQARVDAAKAAP